MAGMISLKETPAEMKAESAEYAAQDYYPQSVYFDADDIEALGLGDKKAGDEFILVTLAHVSRTSTSDSDSGDGSHCMTVELREAMVKPATTDVSKLAEKIFGKS